MATPSNNKEEFYFGETSFNLLMQHRIRRVLVICSQYDFFMLEEDGRIDEQIFMEYVSLNLRYPPVFIHADSAHMALDIIEKEPIDLVIEMLSIGDVDTFELARQIKYRYPLIPIVVLTHFSREVSLRLDREDLSSVEHVFCWLGNSEIFLAIIKLIEDTMNAENDILKVGVQTILLIEDSVRYISSYLPYLYRIILEQSKEFVKEALNEHQQMLLRRGRPKILVAKNQDEAMAFYSKYRGHILGIISDVNYKIEPDRRDTAAKAGLRFCNYVKKDDANIPFLLQSSNIENEEFAISLGVGFLHKYSKNLSNELREYILKNFGFGEFVFRNPETLEAVCSADDLRLLQELILTIPDSILEYHTRRDDLSKWLNARALFPIAQRFKEAHYDDFSSISEVRNFIFQTISNFRVSKARGIIAEFKREKFDDYLFFSRIGEGSLGGKARGLAFINTILQKEKIMHKYPGILISVPPSVVLGTDVFDDFMSLNDLYGIALSSQTDQEILDAFVAANLPEKIKEDLMAIASIAKNPIAVRSSSKLEDSHYQPFAGVYNTYMIAPHSKPEIALLKLEQAIKCVYASVYFKASKAYMTATSNLIDEEKMGVLIQSVCGKNYEGRFYPSLSGVARSVNYYPIAPEKTFDGIVNIAYGLGKQIVEGGTSLRFSPKFPQKIIQLSSPEQALKETQKYFYALDMNANKFNPSTNDTINLLHLPIHEAIVDSNFRFAASTYDLNNQIIRDDIFTEGKKIITFSNILNHHSFPLAEIIADLLAISSHAMNNQVEIEFAVDLDTPVGEPRNFSFLQVRPIVENKPSYQSVVINGNEKNKVLLFSEKALGNGQWKNLTDIVYVKSINYSPAVNKQIAIEIEKINSLLISDNRQYMLIGPGRWGSADPWLGIPVKWAQIARASVIIELGLEEYKIEPSQGTHFFHNLTSFGVGYMTIATSMKGGFFAEEFLNNTPAVNESEHVRHVCFNKPFLIEIDGRSNLGVVWKPNRSKVDRHLDYRKYKFL